MKKIKNPLINTELAPYVDNPWEPMYYGGTTSGHRILYPSDELLIKKGGIQALSLYKALLKDSATQSGFSKFAQEITSRHHIYIPVSNEDPLEVEIVDKLKANIDKINFDTIVRGLLEFYIVGMSVGEIIYSENPVTGEIDLDIEVRDQRRFVWTWDNTEKTLKLRMLTLANRYEGEELPDRKFIVPRFWASSNGDPYGSGLGVVIYPLVKFRRQALENNLIYSDRYATPTVVIKAPQNATTDDITQLESFLNDHSSQRAIILPEGFDYQFISPSGDVAVFKDLNETFTKEINVLLTGEYEVGNVEAGSRSSSEIANMVRVIRAKEISELLYEYINSTFVKWWVDANYGARDEYPRIERDFTDLKNKNTDLTIQDLSTIQEKFAVTIDMQWMTEAYNFKIASTPVAAEESTKVKWDPATDEDGLADLLKSVLEPAAASEEPTSEPASEEPTSEPASEEPIAEES